jgi:hypothetical protein
MQKKTCKTCGKTWIIERFDDHLCVALPKKPRAARATATARPVKGIATGPVVEGSPLVTIRRMV